MAPRRRAIPLRDHGNSFWPIITALIILQIIVPAPAAAFTPYKSTDADTAEPYVREMRFGLIQLERDGEETT